MTPERTAVLVQVCLFKSVTRLISHDVGEGLGAAVAHFVAAQIDEGQRLVAHHPITNVVHPAVAKAVALEVEVFDLVGGLNSTAPR